MNKYKPEFKAKVAIEALKGDKSIAEFEFAQIYGVYPAQIAIRRTAGRPGRPGLLVRTRDAASPRSPEFS